MSAQETPGLVRRATWWLCDPVWPRWRWLHREHGVAIGGWRLRGTPDAIPIPRLRWGIYSRRDWWVTFEISTSGSDPILAFGYQTSPPASGDRGRSR